MLIERYLKMEKVTVIISAKGGSGGSFLSAGLGMALAERKKSVLVIDCVSGMRSIDFMLGISDRLVFDAGDVLAHNCNTENAVYPSDFGGSLYVMPAPLENISVSPDTFRDILETLSYDHILLDCHAGDLAYGLSSHFRTVITVEATPLSVRCGNRVLLECKKNRCRDIRLVINRFSEKDFFGDGLFNDLDEVIDKVGARLLGIVPEDHELSLAFQKGQPVKNKSKAVFALDRIAARMDGFDIPLF